MDEEYFTASNPREAIAAILKNYRHDTCPCGKCEWVSETATPETGSIGTSAGWGIDGSDIDPRVCPACLALLFPGGVVVQHWEINDFVKLLILECNELCQ